MKWMDNAVNRDIIDMLGKVTTLYHRKIIITTMKIILYFYIFISHKLCIYFKFHKINTSGL